MDTIIHFLLNMRIWPVVFTRLDIHILILFTNVQKGSNLSVTMQKSNDKAKRSSQKSNVIKQFVSYCWFLNLFTIYV